MHPRIVELWFALQGLQSTVSFMNTGAHPDDETTAMLAAIALRDGVSISYACANRGEGGQNDIGTEVSEDLGALRTAEMEQACDILGMRMYWLSESPKDTIFDFGFSKSGVETLGKWGRERTLKRFVDIIRAERPDIICPTFLDIPGQHGHHRAMTEAAHLVMDLAADPAYTDSPLPVWQVKKLYLPAWGGGGGAYDDELPPPPATLTIAAKGCDPVTGWSYERIGQQSRAFHRTQGMGRWMAPGEERDWSLHLADSRVEGPDETLSSGIPATVGALAGLSGAEGIADALTTADQELQAARAAFPDYGRILKHASAALTLIRDATHRCPDDVADEITHRLHRKIRQLSQVIRLASGAEARARLDQVWLRPGDTVEAAIETRQGDAEAIDASLDLPDGWQNRNGTLSLGADAALRDAYRPVYDPDQPDAPALRLRLTTYGVDSETTLPLDVPPVVLPARSIAIEPAAAVINTADTRRCLNVTLSNIHPSGATPAFSLPDGWQAEFSGKGAQITAPQDIAPGLYPLVVTLDGAPAQTLCQMDYAHIKPTARGADAVLNVRVVEAKLPDVRTGYIGGGNDRVADWLAALGADVTELSDADLESDAVLAEYDTIVVGIFAMRFRDGLPAAMPKLHKWVAAGGTLLTLYHRPWDNWDAETTAPKPLEIGQPSLRWRVTDENAEVAHVAPQHPALTTPNQIGADDWQRWHKERGLYFAKSWDAAYTPILEMSDPEEQAHRGALLSADIGKGRHTHCALILHHQMEKLTPGAFRLMANLIAKRT